MTIGDNDIRLRLSDNREWAHEFSSSSTAALVRGCCDGRRAANEHGIHPDFPLYLHVYDGSHWVTAEPGGYTKVLSIRDPERVRLDEWRHAWNRIRVAHADYTEHARNIQSLAIAMKMAVTDPVR